MAFVPAGAPGATVPGGPAMRRIRYAILILAVLGIVAFGGAFALSFSSPITV